MAVTSAFPGFAAISLSLIESDGMADTEEAARQRPKLPNSDRKTSSRDGGGQADELIEKHQRASTVSLPRNAAAPVGSSRTAAGSVG